MKVLVKRAGQKGYASVDVEAHATVEDIMAHILREYSVNYARRVFRVTSAGNSLDWSTPLAEQVALRPSQSPIVDILPRVCGGGGDGGSTGAEDRAAYLAMYAGKKHDKVDPAEQRLAQYTTCHLSGKPLQPPCVCDELGNIYNKDAVLTGLLSKTVPKGLPHITSRKSVFDVTLYPFGDSKGSDKDNVIKYGCPVTQLPLNGKYRFVVVRHTESGTGHIVSEKAVKEMGLVVEETIGGRYEDPLLIYPQGDELDAMLDIVMEKHQQQKKDKALKKARKNKHARSEAAAGMSHGKKSKVEALKPKDADAGVWASLFTKKKDVEISNTTKDYMTRGGVKYI